MCLIWTDGGTRRQSVSQRTDAIASANQRKAVSSSTLPSGRSRRIDALLERKERLFGGLSDDASLDLGAWLSSRDLYGLFGLIRVLESE